MPPNREIANALKLARDVILVQSNVFIKELLLSRQIRGGTTKADFADQMEVAISAGELT